MHKLTKIVLLLVFTTAVNATSEEQMIEESKQSIKQFSQQLKNKLQQGMKAGGPVEAIHVCHATAEQISKKVSEQFGWKIARTSLKVRNIKNTADAWEKKVLQDFEGRMKKGEAVEQLEFSAIIDASSSQPVFRYMKAIPTQGICLSCHGEQLSTDVAEKIHQQYPEDQATGFKLGDIRGAFTITRNIN
jgi:hypothetical protein